MGRATFLEDEADLDERLSEVAGRGLEGLNGEQVINPSDIKIIYMTEKGQEAFRKSIPFLEMIKGEDYNIAFVIDYKALVRQRVKDNAEAYLSYQKPRYSFRQHNTYANKHSRLGQ